jgi:15-cis-phytoene synthase
MQTQPTDSRFASAADSSACREALRGGSRTFHASSMVLPGRVRRPAVALYAFCRMADDAIDNGRDRHAALEDLEARLSAIYEGTPARFAADRAFADCVSRFSIPRRLPKALLEGFAWDAEGRRYENLSELRAYAVRVAGTVGVIMGLLMGVRDRGALARACDLGVAMQLTNIARDVGEDARAGRLYLPLDWLREAGIDAEEFLRQPTFSPALGGLIERLLKEADKLYAQSELGIAQLPVSCRPAITAARRLYAEIGHELRRRGCDSVVARTVVPARRKTRILASVALTAHKAAPAAVSCRVLPEADFILRAFPARDSDSASTPSAGSLEGRIAWVIDLFERLERADRRDGSSAR